MRQGLSGLFSEIAPVYDLTNHILTLGLDMVWRQKAARLAAARGGTRWLDVCCGPGEMARALARRAPSHTRVFAADFNAAMVAARPRPPGLGPIRFVLAETGALPFPAGCFDLVSLAFGTRNINTSRDDLLGRFREIRRVLKPGGQFVNLETSQPASGLIRNLYHLYADLGLRRLAAWLTPSRAAYAYLGSSIPRFYDAPRLAGLLLEAGFESVGIRPLCFGAVAIHVANCQ